ncbi:MAG: exosome complex RNA-binding protein Rrp4 [Candidatus Pacearchaeota archaeon]
MSEQEFNEEFDKERKLVTPGEIIVSGNFLPGEGTRKEDNNIIAQRFGLVDEIDRLIKIIPLSGVFNPRRGNIVIGKVEDITFNGWITNIGTAKSSFLPITEVPKYIDKNHLDEFLDIGDFFSAKILGVKQKGIDLSIDSRGLGKLEGGIIILINPNKVPRIIGKSGSMITLIKDRTNTKITVGQNGCIWIKGDKVEDELLAKKAIMFVSDNSFINGLTEKVEEFLDKEKKNGP